MTTYPNNKVHGANMGPIWGRQDPGGPHVGPMNVAIWVQPLVAHKWWKIVKIILKHPFLNFMGELKGVSWDFFNMLSGDTVPKTT